MGQSALSLPYRMPYWAVDFKFRHNGRIVEFRIAATGYSYRKVNMWEPKDSTNPLAGPTGKEPVPKDWPIKGLFLTTGNMVSNHAEQKVTIDEMFSEDKLDFICCIDMFMTDTARQADLFLPCTSWFENDDIVGGLHPYVMRMEKAIEPMGESKGDWDIFKLLAQKMGWGEYFKGDAKDQIDGILDVLGNLFGDHKDRILKEFKENGIARLSIRMRFHCRWRILYANRQGRILFGSWQLYSPKVCCLQLPVNEGHNPLLIFCANGRSMD
jgi:anaerobic selenocysteine-containing dehydrogenase